MNYTLDDDHAVLQQSVRDFATRAIAPGAAQRDSEHRMPPALRKELADMGLYGITVPEQYGGSGMGCIASSIVVEELSKQCASTGVHISAHGSLCVEPIAMFGTEEQKAKYLPGLASGETVGCLALTEPGSGSDAGAARCMAVEKDDGWHVDGTKIFTTNGEEAGLICLIAVTNPDDKRHRLSAFIVEQPSPGLKVAKLEEKLGICSTSTAELLFEDCVVPKQNLLGEPGQGLRVGLTTLDGGRIGIAAQALGIAEACLRESVQYAAERKQFNRPIGAFQAIQAKIADMAVAIEASRELIYRAAWLKDQNRPHEYEGAMAKLFASETANRAAHECVQIFGGYGYCKDYPAERLLRDARITEIYEGTSEIHRLVIARGVMKALEQNWSSTL
ncbi:MAG: acyl-CoA dehydrogenase [bacterium]|nr:acyl-CoA dehydrogenase [bacterium]